MDLTRFGYLTVIEELLDEACCKLPPDEFEKLKSDVKEVIENYEKCPLKTKGNANEEQPSKGCSYYAENGKKPYCTHDCDGCMWYV